MSNIRLYDPERKDRNHGTNIDFPFTQGDAFLVFDFVHHYKPNKEPKNYDMAFTLDVRPLVINGKNYGDIELNFTHVTPDSLLHSCAWFDASFDGWVVDALESDPVPRGGMGGGAIRASLTPAAEKRILEWVMAANETKYPSGAGDTNGVLCHAYRDAYWAWVDTMIQNQILRDVREEHELIVRRVAELDAILENAHITAELGFRVDDIVDRIANHNGYRVVGVTPPYIRRNHLEKPRQFMLRLKSEPNSHTGFHESDVFVTELNWSQKFKDLGFVFPENMEVMTNATL